ARGTARTAQQRICATDSPGAASAARDDQWRADQRWLPLAGAAKLGVVARTCMLRGRDGIPA
ncbi:MAG: hypothetical protein ACRCXB_25275, partial [Aeromonadaceae bacterium]